MAFRHAVLLLPAASLLHLLEEWLPRFPRWARPLLATAVVVALAVHVIEVGHNVFKRW